MLIRWEVYSWWLCLPHRSQAPPATWILRPTNHAALSGENLRRYWSNTQWFRKDCITITEDNTIRDVTPRTFDCCWSPWLWLGWKMCLPGKSSLIQPGSDTEGPNTHSMEEGWDSCGGKNVLSRCLQVKCLRWPSYIYFVDLPLLTSWYEGLRWILRPRKAANYLKALYLAARQE